MEWGVLKNKPGMMRKHTTVVWHGIGRTIRFADLSRSGKAVGNEEADVSEACNIGVDWKIVAGPSSSFCWSLPAAVVCVANKIVLTVDNVDVVVSIVVDVIPLNCRCISLRR